MASEDKAQHFVGCDLCQQPVSLFCRRCGFNLCDSCVPKHLRVKSKYGHNIVDFASKDDDDTCHCDFHPQNECSAYCKKCNVPICMLCISIKHKSHKIFELSGKTEELLQVIAKENDRLQSSKQELERILEHTTKLFSSIPSIYKLRKDEVTARGEEWHKKIAKIVKMLHQELDDMQKEHEVVLQNQKKKFEFMIGEINEINEKTIKFQKSNNVTKMQKFIEVIQKQESLGEVSQYSFPKYFEFEIDKHLMNELKEREQPGKKILEEPTVSSVMDTGFPASKEFQSRLYDMAVTDDCKVWMGGNSHELKLFDLQGNLHYTVSITCQGMYLCIYNKQVVYIDQPNNAVKMISENDTAVTIFTTGDWLPYGVTSAASGDLLVCLGKDDQSKVVRYSSTGTVLQEIQYDSHCQSLYKEAVYISENVNGDIIVADWKKNAVIAVDRLGILRYMYKYENNSTCSDTDLFASTIIRLIEFPIGFRMIHRSFISSVATDFVGHVIVTNYYGDKIDMLDRDGQFLRYIIPEGGINRPRGVCILGHGEMMVGESLTGIAKRIKYLEE